MLAKSARRTAVGWGKYVGQRDVRLPGFTHFEDSKFVTNATLMFTTPFVFGLCLDFLDASQASA
ncbi:hypothetical protein SAMN05421548_1494 [Paraburkholderia lycopersici]|uniref:Uncharacterized protein n=1 Tax=Paraburkholderia lycopersici TaxID=416944 RepID=A0A1G7CXD6_9BURK|nr:hypothetical protein SAMN05421548_1494 [Paraburkholderia lycopersici]